MFDSDQVAVEGALSAYAGKTLYERATGRFYTPDHVAGDLAAQMISALGTLGPEFTLCDPFCGDGQLIAAVLCAIAELDVRPQIHVHLFDQERAAVASAKARIRRLAEELGLSLTIACQIGDSFQRASLGKFDAVITNPPWELLKPDTREMATLSPADQSSYRAWLAARCASLDALFPEAKADVSWAGWGTNLARCGWALALRLCRDEGVLGIVLPATLMGDRASQTMRAHALTEACLIDAAAYPAEARLFARVDQPVVAATFRMRNPKTGTISRIRFHDANRNIVKVTALNSARLAGDDGDFAIPVGFAAGSGELLGLFKNFSTFGDLEGCAPNQIWAGRELDETRVMERLTPGMRHPFVKGRMIQRFDVAEHPASSVRADIADKFRSASFQRIVWRDVARTSQRRRMITALIPPGWIAGNSLHVAYFRSGDDDRLRALLAVMSSYVFEFLVRARLTTGHMSLGAVRRAQLPTLSSKIVRRLAAATHDLNVNSVDQVDLEILVARSYGLKRDIFEAMLKQFPKVLPQERAALLDSDRWV